MMMIFDGETEETKEQEGERERTQHDGEAMMMLLCVDGMYIHEFIIRRNELSQGMFRRNRN